MRIVFFATSKLDLRWFKKYYTDVFPQGRQKADQQYLSVLRILKDNPSIGFPSHEMPGCRELVISKTPFSFIYRLRGDNIEILRNPDNRSDWRAG